MNEAKSKVGVSVVVAALVALVAGGIVGYALGMGSNQGSNNSTTITDQSDHDMDMKDPTMTPAADLRAGLNAALREHVALASVALRNAMDGSPATDAALAELDKNSVEVAGLVGSVYGDEAEKTFLKVWRQHIGFFADYATAAVKGDQAGKDQAKQDLAGYSEQASAFFAEANPNLPQDAVKPLLVEHRDLLLAEIDAHAAGNHEESLAKQTEAYDQVGTIADALAAGIAKQFTDKF